MLSNDLHQWLQTESSRREYISLMLSFISNCIWIANIKRKIRMTLTLIWRGSSARIHYCPAWNSTKFFHQGLLRRLINQELRDLPDHLRTCFNPQSAINLAEGRPCRAVVGWELAEDPHYVAIFQLPLYVKQGVSCPVVSLWFATLRDSQSRSPKLPEGQNLVEIWCMSLSKTQSLSQRFPSRFQ